MDAVSEEHRIEEEQEEIDDDEEEEEVEDEEDDIEEEEEEEGGGGIMTVGRRTGRGLTLKTLLKERVLEPGQGNMTINYLGNKFKGDLLPDGRIRSQETNKIFGTPSAWAIYCKKIVNPDKKSGCGWASVRYRGKKLDAYKNNWFRQKRLEDEKEEEEMEDESCSEGEDVGVHEQEVIEFDSLGNRNVNHDPSTMVELTTFQSLGRMQPFNITMSSSAMGVIDVHAHLTTSEVIGYLAGQWDVNNHNLIVSHAFPVRCRLGDTEKGPAVEQELFAEMSKLKLSLVGWYHTHPFAPPLPSLRDIDSQLDYEMKMKGYNDASYTPVLGIIVSPYQKTTGYVKGIPHANGNASGFWVMPPPENKPLEYGRPMSMQFTVVQDAFIPKEALLHMSEVMKFYKDAPDAVTLADNFEGKYTYWHKLKNSIKGRVPKDHFPPLVDFLTKMIDEKLPEDDPTPPPSAVSQSVTVTPIAAALAAPFSESKGDSLMESEAANTVTIKPFHSDAESLIAAYGDTLIKHKDSTSSPSQHRSCFGEDMSEGKTPPPKIYSPAYQMPLPPLFPLDSSKMSASSKDAQVIKNLFPQLSSEEKKTDYSKSFLHPDVSKYGLDTDLWASDLSTGSKNDVLSELALKLRKKSSLDAASTSGSSLLDFSLSGNKSGQSEKSKKIPSTAESQRAKDYKDPKMAGMDISAWFAQAFALPPPEREHPFARDMAPLFPPEFLSSQWNPAAAAAALQLSRESSKSAFHQDASNLFMHKSLLPNFARDNSKPTYHSDVPLLLKKQQDDIPSSSKGSAEDSKEKKKYVDPRDPRDFRVPKETRDKDVRERRERDRSPLSAREQRDAHVAKKDGRTYRDIPKDPREMKELWQSVSPKDVVQDSLSMGKDLRSALFRDFTDPSLMFNPSFSSNLRDILDLRGKDPVKLARESVSVRDTIRQSCEGASSKTVSKEQGEPKVLRTEAIKEGETTKNFPGEHSKGLINLRDPSELVSIRDSLNYKESRDAKESKTRTVDSGSLNELKNLIENRNFAESSELRKFVEHKIPSANLESQPLPESISHSKVLNLGDSKGARDLRVRDEIKDNLRDTGDVIDLRQAVDKRKMAPPEMRPVEPKRDEYFASDLSRNVPIRDDEPRNLSSAHVVEPNDKSAEIEERPKVTLDVPPKEKELSPISLVQSGRRQEDEPMDFS